MKALTKTDFNFPGQKSVYHGKVRDVYNINGEKLVMVATDRISAFDVVLPKGIPFKGQMLNQIAAKFLDATTDICPNWKMATPDPMVTVGVMCEGFPVEMIVRGYLCGSAWRAYKSGVREICGVKLPEGMKENQKFPEPIITPTTKAEIGEHDADISKEEILAQGLATPEEYAVLEKYTMALFKRGTEIAAERGLILVDTKYEFGKHDGKIYLMDEIHTPDSSRYFYSEGYEERFAKGEPQKQLSKEFVREWLMDNGFQGKEGQQVPEMTDEIVTSISERYIELYEHITGEKFVKEDTIFSDNLIRNNRARGSLFSTPRQTVVENNVFDHTSGTAILLCGDCNGWFETGACRNVLIRKNKFINSLTNMFQFTNAIISIYPEIPDLASQRKYFHSDIVIDANEFITFDRPLVYAKSVDGLVFTNNIVKQNKEYPAFHWNNYRFYFQRVIHSRIEKNYFDEGFIRERDVLEENN